MSRIGVLALQGDVREHVRSLTRVGAEPFEVKTVSDLEDADGLVIPGGESTTMGKLAVRFGLFEPMKAAIEGGLPVYGTCAGMILVASGTVEGHQPQLGVLDAIVRRNAFGRQNESFETSLEVVGLPEPFPAVFIRAPWVEKAGTGVEVLAAVDGHPVLVREGNVLAGSFHPELTDDLRIHRFFVDMVKG